MAILILACDFGVISLPNLIWNMYLNVPTFTEIK